MPSKGSVTARGVERRRLLVLGVVTVLVLGATALTWARMGRARADGDDRRFLESVARAALGVIGGSGGMATAATPARLAGVLEGRELIPVGASTGPREVVTAVSGDRLGLAVRSRSGNCQLAEASPGKAPVSWTYHRDLGGDCTGQVALRGHVADPPQPTPVLYRSSTGDLSALVEHFTAALPGPRSRRYANPTRDEREQFVAALQDARAGDLTTAARTLAGLRCQVLRHVDTATGRTAVIVVESAGGRRSRGWGMYVVVPGRPASIVVEVPHPVADLHTERTGVEVFRTAAADALLVAGANRYADRDGSADVAHNDRSLFQAVSEALVGAGTRVVQLHGFSETGHPTYGDAVLSTGASPPSRVVQELGNVLSAAGFDACVYDGVACRSLAATTNVQGRAARAAGAEFVHVEIADRVRDDPGRLMLLADTVARTVAAR